MKNHDGNGKDKAKHLEARKRTRRILTKLNSTRQILSLSLTPSDENVSVSLHVAGAGTGVAVTHVQLKLR